MNAMRAAVARPALSRVLRCAVLAAFLALPAAPRAAATEAPAREAVTDAETPGGVRLAHLALPDESEQAIAFFWRDGGALAAPEKAGLIELAPNLIVAGGGARFDGAAMDEALKDYGASLALRRSAATTTGELSASARHFAQAADVLADMLTAPRLPPRTLERERAALLAGVRAQTERPDRLASRLLTRALFGRAPERALWLMEPREVVEGIAVADVEAWRRATLGRDNLTVVAAGPMPRAEIEAIVDRAFGALPARAAAPRADVPAPAAPARTILVLRPVPQAVLSMGAALRWPDREAPEARAIISGALGGGPGSRLWIAVRERLGVSYGARSFMAPLGQDLYRLTLQSSVAPQAVAQALATMRAEYDRLRAEGLAEAEIAPIRKKLIAGQADAMGVAGSAAATIRGALIAGRDAGAALRYGREVAALDAARIRTLIAERFPERLTTIIVAPAAEGVVADCVVAPTEDFSVCE